MFKAAATLAGRLPDRHMANRKGPRRRGCAAADRRGGCPLDLLTLQLLRQTTTQEEKVMVA